MSGSTATTGVGGSGVGVSHKQRFLAKRFEKSQASAEKFQEPCGEHWLSNFVSTLEFASTKLTLRPQV